MLRGGAASSESETAWAESDLVTVQLNVLERQGRLEEALHLADATRQADHCAMYGTLTISQLAFTPLKSPMCLPTTQAPVRRSRLQRPSV
jgi:hypothetical protein